MLVRHALGLLFLFSWIANPLSGGGEPTEYQLKAIFLLNFIRFVEWPSDAFQSAGDPLVVGILGKDPFGSVLDQTVASKTINGRAVIVRRISGAAAIRSCQVIFLAGSDARRANDMASTVVSRGILIVGESEGFAERGGMINFVVEDKHVRFEINPSAATRAGLKISSKLLQLAIVVGEKGAGK
jgi:hypothetical protein